MGASKVGRNDPCPCGSGKKYKHCCLGKETQGSTAGDSRDRPNRASEVLEQLRQEMEDREFESLAQVQRFGDRLMEERNRRPLDDFHGLSPEQMTLFIYRPFESPELLEFPEVLEIEPVAPILTLWDALVEAAGEKGLKATAKGNLPRAFCREAARLAWGEDKYAMRTEFGQIYREDEVRELQVMRYTAQFAGLIRKYSGRFVLTKKYRQLRDKFGNKGVYPLLFQAYVRKFNWAYWGYRPELDIIQWSFAYTLYLLSRFGAQERPASFYEQSFLRAYPDALYEVDEPVYMSVEELVSSAYHHRALFGFARLLGLARVEPVTRELLERRYVVEKLPLLDHVVKFHLEYGRSSAMG